MVERTRLIGQILKRLGFIEEWQVQEALQIQQEEGGLIGEILIRLGHLDEKSLTMGLANQAGLEFVELSNLNIPENIISLVDPSTARVFQVVPIRKEGDELIVATSERGNISVADDLSFTTGLNIKMALAEKSDLEKAIKKYYPEEQNLKREGVKSVIEEIKSKGTDLDLSDPKAAAHAGPVVKLLNYILLHAIEDRASDIHLEPFENDFKVRYRVDGVLYEMESPPPHLAVALISRVKVLAKLDIAETRFPQDGRIQANIGGRPVDLRVSTLPTMFGESCVLRVLDRSVVSLDLNNLGLDPKEIEEIKRLIKLPHGIILVTGPTGSGKTTTLYAALNEANDEGIKIITTEDPVEYDLDGIIQIPVNEEIGVTYAKVLRTILRQDPDKILVGEIRDFETAQTAVEASLTGHVVFSTLHTNDAPSAITRLIDIGVEPYLITATLQAVIAQRLVRKICTKCKTPYKPNDEVLAELGLTRDEIQDKEFFFGKGCEECHHTGYKGRTGIFEIMILDEYLRELILEQVPLDKLREAAKERGMRTLREAGIKAIFDGITTVEEVVRETFID